MKISSAHLAVACFILNESAGFETKALPSSPFAVKKKHASILYFSPSNSNTHKINRRIIYGTISKDDTLDGVNDIAAEAEAAIRQAQAALEIADIGNVPLATSKNKAEIPMPISPEKIKSKLRQQHQELLKPEVIQKEETQEMQIEALISSIGASFVGVLTGFALDAYLVLHKVENVSTYPGFLPILLGLSLGVTAFILGKEDTQSGITTRMVFGEPVKKAGNATRKTITSVIDGAVDEVKATPVKVKQSIQAKQEEVVKEIKATPRKVQNALDDKVQETMNELAAIPTTVKAAAAKEAEKAVKNIKAAPRKAVEGTKQSALNTVRGIKEKSSNATSAALNFPGQVLNEVSKTVDNIGQKKQ